MLLKYIWTAIYYIISKLGMIRYDREGFITNKFIARAWLRTYAIESNLIFGHKLTLHTNKRTGKFAFNLYFGCRFIDVDIERLRVRIEDYGPPVFFVNCPKLNTLIGAPLEYKNCFINNCPNVILLEYLDTERPYDLYYNIINYTGETLVCKTYSDNRLNIPERVMYPKEKRVSVLVEWLLTKSPNIKHSLNYVKRNDKELYTNTIPELIKRAVELEHEEVMNMFSEDVIKIAEISLQGNHRL